MFFEENCNLPKKPKWVPSGFVHLRKRDNNLISALKLNSKIPASTLTTESSSKRCEQSLLESGPFRFILSSDEKISRCDSGHISYETINRIFLLIAAKTSTRVFLLKRITQMRWKSPPLSVFSALRPFFKKIYPKGPPSIF